MDMQHTPIIDSLNRENLGPNTNAILDQTIAVPEKQWFGMPSAQLSYLRGATKDDASLLAALYSWRYQEVDGANDDQSEQYQKSKPRTPLELREFFVRHLQIVLCGGQHESADCPNPRVETCPQKLMGNAACLHGCDAEHLSYEKIVAQTLFDVTMGVELILHNLGKTEQQTLIQKTREELASLRNLGNSIDGRANAAFHLGDVGKVGAVRSEQLDFGPQVQDAVVQIICAIESAFELTPLTEAQIETAKRTVEPTISPFEFIE